MTNLKLQIDKEINLSNMPKKCKQRIIKKAINLVQMCSSKNSLVKIEQMRREIKIFM